MVKNAPFYAAALSIILCVAPTPAAAESLAEAIAAAYRNNPEVNASRADLRAEAQTIAQAKAAFGPSLSASASYGYTFDQTRSPVGTDEVNEWRPNYSASLQQPIFSSGRYTAALSRSLHTTEISKQIVRATEQDIAVRVIQAYTNILRDADLVAISRKNVGLLQDQFTLTNRKLELRDGTRTDVDQTMTRFATAQAQLRLAQSNYEASRASFRALTGHYPASLDPLPPLPPLPATIDGAYELADVNSPDLAAAALREAVTRDAVAAARAERGPMVTLNGQVGRTPFSQAGEDFTRTVATAGVTATLPLYSGGLVTAQLREALQRNQAEQFRVEQTRRGVRESIAQSWERIAANREAIPRFRQAVKAGEAAVEGARKQAIAGAFTTVEVLDVTRDLLNAQTAAVQADAEAYIRHADLLRRMGVLDVRTFDPSLAYDMDNFARKDGLAGLPLQPPLQLIDSVVKNSAVRPAAVEKENQSQGSAMPPPPAPAPAITP